jgi:hypothetical protein
VIVRRSHARARRLTILVLLSALLVAGCSSSDGHDNPAPSMKDVTALLSRHGHAVLDHSAAAFVADVDKDKSDSAFRTRQSQLIDNISDVPLKTWTYAVSAQVTDASAQQAAAKRYGAPALIVRVSLVYQLAGIDQTPTPHDLWWTFVRRGGRVYLAGDNDLAQAGGVSWQGPWDFGPVVVARGSASLMLGHIASALQLTKLADVVDAAIPAVTAVWGSEWSQRVAVFVPDSATEFAALVGTAAGTDVSAVALTDGVDPVSHQPYGQRLVFEPNVLGTLSGVGEQIVVRHEITHLATATATSSTTPRWLVEGFADYVGQAGDGQSVATAAAELRAEVRHGTVPTALPSDADFAAGAKRLPQIYEESWLACRLIAARAGVAGLVRFYRSVGTATLPASFAITQGLRQVLGLSTAQFTAQWRTYVKAQLS